MQAAWLLFFVCFFQHDVPYKEKAEFEVKLDYQFKERGQYSSNTLIYGDKRREVDGNVTKTVLPYVVLKLKILKLNGEDRLTIDTNFRNNLLARKHIEIGKEYLIDLGFTSDIKDRITANEYIVLLLSADKTPISRIVIVVEMDGTFKVNGETRGKF